MFTAAISIIAKLWKESRCPTTDEWIKKMSHTHTHTHTQILFSAKKEENPVISPKKTYKHPTDT